MRLPGVRVCQNYRIMGDDKIANAAADRDVARGSLAGTKQHTINFAQTNWIAFVETGSSKDTLRPAGVYLPVLGRRR